MSANNHAEEHDDLFNLAYPYEDYQPHSHSENHAESDRASVDDESGSVHEIKLVNEEQSIKNILEFIKCFICLQKCSDPVICPSCSGLACRSCLTKWIRDKKKECPVCKRDLDESQIIKCWFLDDISQFLEEHQRKLSVFQSQSEIKGKESDLCQDHNL